MKDIEHARMMLGLARKDFKALGGMADTDVFDDSIFGFHVQQTTRETLCEPLTRGCGEIML